MKEVFPKNWTRQDEALFCKFWSVLPRQSRVAKSYARKCWKRLEIEITDMEHIAASLERLKNSLNWRNGYAPNASTIINQQRWDDEGGAEPTKPATEQPRCKACHLTKEYHAVNERQGICTEFQV